MNKQEGPGASATLWTPSRKQIRDSNITQFIGYVNKEHGLSFKQYSELYNWSIEQVSDFWSAIWEYTGIIASHRYDRVVDDLSEFPGAKWFPGARLNFAENLLRHRDAMPALISRTESGGRSDLTHAELYSKVASLSHSMRGMGVQTGDRVVGFFSNIPQATVAMLATTSIGALWGCVGAEIGAGAALDRIGQIRPKLLFAVDGYRYKGRSFDILSNVETLSRVPSIEKTIIVHQRGTRAGHIPNSLDYDELMRKEKSLEIDFEQLPADHPVYIMFSSGTTGKPKCMVQGAAGLLANQLKEIILHADLKNTDRVTYITSPSWMMWNWLMSCLATGASVVLYDGNPLYPDWTNMWRIVRDEKVTVFGCSASYINNLKGLGVHPGTVHDLSSLREISQTGSPLSSDGFEWVYREIKHDLHLNSISGGTDINGCFAGGVPILPVHAGELQAPGLGMKIKAYDENGNPVWDQMGELVCEAPAPSMPLCFWNDPQDKRYRETYFEYYQSAGKNVWRHGDFVVFHSNTGGITFFGRSDAVIKPSGVRIGTSEIYNVVEKIPEIEDSLAIGQNWKDDQRIILFIKPAPNQHLTEALKEKIRKALREEASPKHVPAIIVEVPDIPYTFNMKKVEVAVSNIVNHKPVTNRAVLVNPQSLDFYQKLQSILQRD